MVPACSSGTLSNVLPHRNAMLQTQDSTPHPVTVYIHGADLSLCYPLMWNVTLEYTATHFNVLGETRPGNPSPTFHTHQGTLMLSWWSTVGSSVESTYQPGLEPWTCGVKPKTTHFQVVFQFLCTNHISKMSQLKAYWICMPQNSSL